MMGQRGRNFELDDTFLLYVEVANGSVKVQLDGWMDNMHEDACIEEEYFVQAIVKNFIRNIYSYRLCSIGFSEKVDSVQAVCT